MEITDAQEQITESQIITTLKQVEGGRQVKDVCRDNPPAYLLACHCAKP